MGRFILIAVVSGFSLDMCDEPSGPQPDKPIRPPEGYTGEPPPGTLPPGLTPPTPKGPEAGDAAVAKAAPPPTAPVLADPPKCPQDPTGLITAKVKPHKDKKKKGFELKLTAKSGAPILFKKVSKTDDGSSEDVKAEGGELTATVTPESAKAKAKLTVAVQCGWEDRVVIVTADGKGATMREVPRPPEPGFLNLVGQPGVKVSTGGKELGVTPLRAVPLPPGKYQLKLQPPKGKPRTVAVEIKSAETSTVQDKK
jgi:hypothetical protein